jgi:hypothetical protein
MKVNMKRNVTMISSVILVACMLAPTVGAGLMAKNSSVVPRSQPSEKHTSAGQYWGLIFAVGYYNGAPDDFNRPDMIDSANNMYNALTGAGNWQADHIQMLQSSQATGKNLIRSLWWLVQNSKSTDYVVVYITTHGSQMKHNGLPLDLPPKDEGDGMDEFLMMYDGYVNKNAIIWDDVLNFFLGLIKCQGLCLIIDSCYSGGFNDAPMRAQNRITLMSSLETEPSWGSYFSEFIIDGFNGAGDQYGNQDGVTSAEEAFAYAEPLTEFFVWLMGESQTPTIVDGYPNEFPVTS